MSSVTTALFDILSDLSTHYASRLGGGSLGTSSGRAEQEHRRKVASNYHAWESASKELDRLEGREAWKHRDASPEYDWELVQDRLRQLREAREATDLAASVFLLRTSLGRNLGDMGSKMNYGHTYYGTKRLIEDYIDEVTNQLNTLADAPMLPDSGEEGAPFTGETERYDFFSSVRHAYGRTALLLSGGATFGLTHIGVIKALVENNLLPRIISGSSSGSIIASMIGTTTDAELPRLLQENRIDLDFFTNPDEDEGVRALLVRFACTGVLYDIGVLKACLERNLRQITFLEAYHLTRRVLSVTVSCAGPHEMPRLLNYLTAPNVIIASAVAASCSAPGLFAGSELLSKDRRGVISEWSMQGTEWIDGSVENDLPMDRLAEQFNVNHFIVCQVNPHVYPFLDRASGASPPGRLGRMISGGVDLALGELKHRLSQMEDIGIIPGWSRMTRSILSQRYQGDINIVPEIRPQDFLHVIANPNLSMLKNASLRGEQATWPVMAMIRNHCQVELTLDDILYRLRLRRLERDRTEVKYLDATRRSKSSITLGHEMFSAHYSSSDSDEAIDGPPESVLV